jgi:regulator of replication initiation timing
VTLLKRFAVAFRLARAALLGKLNVNPHNIGTFVLTETTKHVIAENERLTRENVELRVRVEQLTIANTNRGTPYRDVKPS